ncbi:MAG: hypothetical protein AAF517_11400 [Planctomycetota bacterium]
MKVRAAAVSREGVQCVVVYCGMDLIRNTGEAELTVESLRTRFGAPVVLLAEDDQDHPNFYGDEPVIRALKGLAVDEMPWQDYEV